ncbi:MAG: hypothetical protein HZA68_07775 [Rhodovulum sp.]|nr:hypothetical protein [Rhodovulum sp.]
MPRITNTQAGPRGVNAASGPIILHPGETAELDLSDAEQAVARRTGWFEFGEPEPAGPAVTVPDLHAVHRGRGSYSIMQGEEELADGLTKADADAFNALSPADRAAFVADKS